MAVVYPPKTTFAGGEAARAGGADALLVPPGVKFTARERRVWAYIVARLEEDGLAPPTAGIVVSVVVRMYVAWLDAEQKLREVIAEHDGSYYVKSERGHEQPHQAYYVCRNLRAELCKWLPECCLTLPSRANVLAKVPEAGPRDDLFDSLAGHGARHPGSSCS